VTSTTAAPPDYIIPTYRRWPVEFTSGQGARLQSADGRSYLDCVAGIAVASVGHAHPRVAAAIAQQARQLIHVSNLYETAPQRKLAARLADLTGGMCSFFCNSGAEAIESALKLARRRAHDRGIARPRIVTAVNGFHGRTLGALAATGQPAKRAPFGPLPEGFTYVAYGDSEALEAAFDHDVAAVLLEPIQGEAGVVVPADGYLASARRLCDRWGALLMLDEIQTGMGRTGTWWAHQQEAFSPDVMCLAKGLAGGLPMGACLATPEAGAAFAPGDHASTFGGGPVQSAAALATLDVIEDEGLLRRARAGGERLSAGLRRIWPTQEVRGRGLLLAVALDRPCARDIAERALARGLLVNDATPAALRLTPPLVISYEEIDEALAILAEVADEV
jgi:acetylornithine/N-succinyldiaminopimelate aminotransferase